MKIVIAQTAASGAIYTRQILELLLQDTNVEEIALIRSRQAEEVAQFEGQDLQFDDNKRVVEYANNDMFAPVASGSAQYDAMIVAPCSVGTVARIASGVSDSLITRAADVMIKERRRLILVVRESPISLIHLNNMSTVTQAGAIVMPASPSFYAGESSIEDLCLTISRRAVRMAGGECDFKEWSGKN